MHSCACGVNFGDEIKPELTVSTPWGTVRIQRCSACSLAQTADFLSLENLAQIYEGADVYRPGSREVFEAQVTSFNHVVQDLKKLQITSGRILEIGCNTGFALVAFRKRDFDVTGVEKNPECSEYARSRYALRVFSDLSEIPKGEQFQVIFISHLLEHLVSINKFLMDIHRFTEVGSVLYVKTPNYSSLIAKYALRGKWPGFIPLQHVWYFEKKTLTNLLSKHGYVPIRLYTRIFAFASSKNPLKLAGRVVLGTLEKLLDRGSEIVGIYRCIEP